MSPVIDNPFDEIKELKKGHKDNNGQNNSTSNLNHRGDLTKNAYH